MILNHKFDSLASIDFTILDKGEIIMEYFVARVKKDAKSLATWKLYKSDREALKGSQELEEIGNIKKINVEEIKMDSMTDDDIDLEIGQKYAVVKGNSEIAFGIVTLGSEFTFKLRPDDEKDQGIRAYHAKFKKSTAVQSPKKDAENNAVIGNEKDNRLDKDTNKNVRIVNDAYYVVPSKTAKCWTLSNSMGKVGFLLTCEREHINPEDANSKEVIRAEKMEKIGIDTPLKTGKYYYYKDNRGNIYTFTLKKLGTSKPKDGQESKTVYMVNGYPHILFSNFEKNARETLESSNLTLFNNRFGSGKKMNAVMLEKGGESGVFGKKNYSICWSGNLIGIAGHVPQYKNAWLLIKNDKNNSIPYTTRGVVDGIIGVVCDEGKNVMTSESQPPVGCCYYCVDPKVNRAGNVMYKLTISEKETGKNSTSEGKIYEDNTALCVVEAKNIETVNGNNAPAAKGDDVNNQAGEKKEDSNEAPAVADIPVAPPAPAAPVAPPPPILSGVQPGYSGKPKANDDKEVKKEAQPELPPEKKTFIKSLGLNKQIKFASSGDAGAAKGESVQELKEKFKSRPKSEAHEYLSDQEPKKVEEKIERTQDKFVAADRGNNSVLEQEKDEVVEAFPELKSDIDAKLAKEEKERQKQAQKQEEVQNPQAPVKEEVVKDDVQQDQHPEEHPQGGNAPKPMKAVEKAEVKGDLNDYKNYENKSKAIKSIFEEIDEMDKKLQKLGVSVDVQVKPTGGDIIKIQGGIENLYNNILKTTYEKNKGKDIPQNSSDNKDFITGVGKTLPKRFGEFKITFVDLISKEKTVKDKKDEKGKKNKKDKEEIKNLNKEIKDLDKEIKSLEKEVTEKWNRISKALRKEFEFIELESSRFKRFTHAIASVGKAIGLISRSDSTKIKRCFNSAAKYFCSHSGKNFKLSVLLSVFKDAKKVEEELYDGLKKILDNEKIKSCIIGDKNDKTKQMKVALAAVIISIMKIQNPENIVSACIGFRDGFTEDIKYDDGVTIAAGDVKTLCGSIISSDLENRRQKDIEGTTLGKAIKNSFASGGCLEGLVTDSEYKNIRRTIGLSQKPDLLTKEKQQDK